MEPLKKRTEHRKEPPVNKITRCANGVIAADAGALNRLQTADSASLLLLSDTHGAVDAVRWIFTSVGSACDACLFAGDGAVDIFSLVREAAAGALTIPPVILMAQGNCDSERYPPVLHNTEEPKPFGLPLYQQKLIAGQRILLTHGHLYHVELDSRKLCMAAENQGCTIAVHGHTHVQNIESFGSVTAINPGSPLRPRGQSYGGFAILSLRPAHEEQPAGDTGNPINSLPAESFGSVQFYRLIQDRSGSYSAAVHAEYPLRFAE